MLYRNGKVILLANVLIAALVVGILWNWAGLPSLVWLAGIWLVTAVRAGLLFAYHEFRAGPEAARRWAILFTLGSAASGITWGLGCYVMFMPGEVVAQLVVTYAVAGMAAGAVATLSVWLPAAGAFMTPMLLGQIVVLVLQVDRQYAVMAAMTGLMMVIFLAVAASFNRSLLGSLSLRFENLLLGDKLEQAQLTEAAKKVKSRFFAAMSHELRTPLNAILGFSEIIKTETFGPISPAQYKGYAMSIHDSAERLHQLVKEILLLADIEAGDAKLSEEPFDLRKSIVDAVAALQGSAEAEGVVLVIELSDACPVLRADRLAFDQIVRKLLSNALRLTPRGGEVTLVTNLDEEGNFVLEVTDMGEGLSEADLPTAMSDFGCTDTTVAGRLNGPGFGLSVVKALVEIHGGSLHMRGAIPRGTTIAARFPAEQVIVPERGFGQTRPQS